jgi:metal-responsive CopG/Arc/MetJ family transcriptional regulator
MNTVRVNVQVPEDLAREVERLTGRRRRNQFILEAIKHRVEEIHKEKLHRCLIKGYQTTHDVDCEITREFEAIDMEGWDDY